jgi:hypothetical protein
LHRDLCEQRFVCHHVAATKVLCLEDHRVLSRASGERAMDSGGSGVGDERIWRIAGNLCVSMVSGIGSLAGRILPDILQNG